MGPVINLSALIGGKFVFQKKSGDTPDYKPLLNTNHI